MENQVNIFETLAKKTLAFINQFTSESFNICAIILLHCAALPTFLANLSSFADRMPPVDIFLLLYSGLFVLLIKAIAAKEIFSMVLNATGFFVQVVFLSLIVFR